MKKVGYFIRRNIKRIYLIIISIFIVMNVCLFTFIFKLDNELKSTEKKFLEQSKCEIEVGPNDNFVFLGDSITEQYPTEELFDGLPVVNSGVRGNTSKDILDNLNERVYVYNPSKVFLLVGINDINNEIPTDEIADNIKKIVKKINKNRPSAEVFIISVYPINDTDDEKINFEMVGSRNNKEVKELNKKLEDYCDANDIEYIDIYSELVDNNGNLNLKYTTEGLHISHTGYLKITKILYKYL